MTAFKRITDCHLETDPRFAHVPGELIAALNAIGQLRSYRAGHTVRFDGDGSDFVGSVKSGVLRLMRRSRTGQEHILGLLQPGDLFGRDIDPAEGCTIEAATPAEILCFARAGFESLLRDSPHLQRVVQAGARDRLATTRDWLVIVSNHRMKSRLAGFLITLYARRNGAGPSPPAKRDGADIRFPISRLDLASLLGTRQESISRALHALDDEGTIRILEPNLIRILDLAALAEMAGADGLTAAAGLAEPGRRSFRAS